MKQIILDLYRTFRCIAQECPSTCCAGWKIKIATEDYERFQNMEPHWLRKDIQKNTYREAGAYYFKNDDRQRCAMLDSDGLCRIQRNTTEQTLCNTCRKYPRLANQIGEYAYLSMAASCPVVADYLTGQKVEWFCMEAAQLEKKIIPSQIELLSEVWQYYEENQSLAVQYAAQKSNIDFLYPGFEKMADELLELVTAYQEGKVLLPFLEKMEQDLSGCVEEFVLKTQSAWKKLSENYMTYRLLTRRLEYPKESVARTVRQATGELFLIRMIAFLRFSDAGSLLRKDWSEVLCKVYRFTAHGQKLSEKLQDIWKAFFSQDFLWFYILR